MVTGTPRYFSIILSVTFGNCPLAMVQTSERRDRVGADLADQRGEVVVETLAQHQAVAERQDDDEGLHDGPARRLDAEVTADVAAMPGRLADVAVVGDIAPLAVAAPHFDVER